ncbi:MAG: T9SS type A sorting domain-containing protein [Candidatus Zixiibacteriota bacterium]|jgi:hypothetical protein
MFRIINSFVLFFAAAAAYGAWKPMPRLALVNDASADSLYYYCAAAPAFVFRHGGDDFQAPVLAGDAGNETTGFFLQSYKAYLQGRGGLSQLVALGGVDAADVEYTRDFFGLGEGEVWEINGAPAAAACELSRDWSSSEYVVVAPYVENPTAEDVESVANAASIAAYLNAPLFYAGSAGLSERTLEYIGYLAPSRAVVVEIGDTLPASVNAALSGLGAAVAADLTTEREVVTYINEMTDPAPPVLCAFRGEGMAAPAAVAAARYGGYVLAVPDGITSQAGDAWDAVLALVPRSREKLTGPYTMPAAVLDAEQDVADRFYAWLEDLGGTDPDQLEYVLTFAPAFGPDSISYVFDRALIGDTETPDERGAVPGRFVNTTAENLASFSFASSYRALIFSNPRPERVTFCGLVYMAQNVVTCPDFFTDNYGRDHKVNELLGCRAGGYDDPGVFTDFAEDAYDPVVHNGRNAGAGQHPFVPAEDLVGFQNDIYEGTGFFYVSTHGTEDGFFPFDVDEGVAANVPWNEADWPGGPAGYVNYDGDRRFSYNDWARMGRNNFGLVAAFNACCVGGGEMNAVVTRRLGAASISSYTMVGAGGAGWFWISFVNRMLEHGYTLGEALCFATAQVSEIFPAGRPGVDSSIRFVLAGDPFMEYYRPTWQPPTPADPELDYGGHNPGGSGPLARGFTARAGERCVTLFWEGPGDGRPLSGWNLYRGEGRNAAAPPSGGETGPVRVNASLITGRSPFVYVDEPLVNGKVYYYWVEGVEAGGRSSGAGPAAACPRADYGKAGFALAQNYPNPFRARTNIVFAVPEEGNVKLTVYDLRGAPVRRLWAGPASRGGHAISWDGSADDGTPLPPGVYFCRLETATRAATRKMVIVE